MYIGDQLLDADMAFLADLAFAVILVQALRYAPWRALIQGRRVHLVLAAAVSLMALWALRAGVSPGLTIHFLALTSVTLMLGWELALLAGTLALVGVSLATSAPATGFAANALVTVVVPVAISYGIFRLVDARVPHLMTYVLLCAFLGSAVAIVASSLAAATMLAISGAYTWQQMGYEYLGYLPLVALPEGLLNGTIMTAMVMLRPDWIRTYDDRRYLLGK